MRQHRHIKSFLPVRHGAARVAVLVLLLGAAAWSSRDVWGAPLRQSPSDALRQVLRQDDPLLVSRPDPMKDDEKAKFEAYKKAVDFRRDLLEKRSKELQSLIDLARALQFPEWRDEDRADGRQPREVAEGDRAIRDDIGKRFTEKVKEVFGGEDAAGKAATAILVGDMAVEERKNLRPTSTLVREVLKKLAVPLGQLADDPDPRVGEAVARALGQVQADAKDTVQPLSKMLESKNVTVRRAAAEALTTIMRTVVQGDQRPGIDLPAPPPGRPPPLARSPEQIVAVGQAVAPAAGAGVSDKDPEVQRHSVQALFVAAEALIPLIADPTTADKFPFKNRPLSEEDKKEIQKYAKEVDEELTLYRPLLEALWKQSPALAKALGRSDPAVRVEAAATLERIGHLRQKLLARQKSIPPLDAKPAPDRESPQASRDGRGAGTLISFQAGTADKDEALGTANQREQVVRALAGRLVDPSPRARLAAVDALEYMGDDAQPAASALVRTSLSDPDRFVRWAAARTVGKMKPEPSLAVPALARLLADPDLDVRKTAAYALEQYGPDAAAAVPALARAAGTGDYEIRVAALHALEGIGTEAAPAVPAMVATLSHPDSRVRRAGAEVIGRFGPLAVDAAPALRKALEDPDAGVRKAASDALLNVEPPAKK